MCLKPAEKFGSLVRKYLSYMKVYSMAFFIFWLTVTRTQSFDAKINVNYFWEGEVTNYRKCKICNLVLKFFWDFFLFAKYNSINDCFLMFLLLILIK